MGVFLVFVRRSRLYRRNLCRYNSLQSESDGGYRYYSGEPAEITAHRCSNVCGGVEVLADVALWRPSFERRSSGSGRQDQAEDNVQGRFVACAHKVCSYVFLRIHSLVSLNQS
jgi:hypothetical protein